MSKNIIYSVFALALLTTTLGCPPPAPTGGNVDISTDPTATVTETPGDNMTGPGDNMTAVTETPSDNLTTGSETP